MITACAGIAQLVEHLIRNEGVAGSNPVSGTTLRVAIYIFVVGFFIFDFGSDGVPDNFAFRLFHL